MWKKLLSSLLITGLLVLLMPHVFSAQEEYYTIQAATYLSIIEAEENYEMLYNRLSEEQRDYLRIELIKGKYYTLRIGKYSSYSEAQPLLKKVRESFPTAYIMKAYIKDERIKRMYVKEYSAVKKPATVTERPVEEEKTRETVRVPQAPPEKKTAEITRKEPSKKKAPVKEEKSEMKKTGVLLYVAAGVILVLAAFLTFRMLHGSVGFKIPGLLSNNQSGLIKDLNLKNLTEDSIKGYVDELKNRVEFIINDVGLQNLPDNVEYIESDEDSVVVYRELKDVLHIKKNIIVLTSTAISAGSVIKGGVFVKGNTSVEDNVIVDNLFSEGEVSTGKSVRFNRILYADGTVNIGDENYIGELAFTDGEIILNRGVFFRNIYGRPIKTYNYKEEPLLYDYTDLHTPHLDELPFPIKSLKNTIWFSKEDFIVPERVRIHKNLVTRSGLTISKGSIIHGYIKAHKDIYLGSHVSINGDVISYNDLYIGDNVRIYGDIYVKGRIHIDPGARLGRRAKVINITSNNEIRISEDVEIFGMIKSKRGTII